MRKHRLKQRPERMYAAHAPLLIGCLTMVLLAGCGNFFSAKPEQNPSLDEQFNPLYPSDRASIYLDSNLPGVLGEEETAGKLNPHPHNFGQHQKAPE